MLEDKVTVLVPVLNRPKNIEPLIQSINSNTDDPWIMFMFTPGYCPELEVELYRCFREYENMEVWSSESHLPQIGDYATKINKLLRRAVTEWVFTGADDLRFHPHWFDNALRTAKVENAKVVGTQDMGNPRVKKGKHATHFLVNTQYAMDVGCTATHEQERIFCPEYWHEYVDDELIGVAKAKGHYAFAHDSKVEHLHPRWRKAATDAIYDKAEERLAYGRTIFARRRSLWTSS